MKKLAVIDGKSLFYRGYYAMPNLSLPDGTPTGGVYGFASIAIELIKKIQPDYVAVAWDKRGTNIRKRRQIYPDYKANRKPAPDDFYAQIPLLMELLNAFGWPFYEIDDYEADDILGAFARQAKIKGIETYLLTSDLDSLQLIDDNTKVYAIKNGLSNLEEFDVPAFEKKYGISVDQFLDLKSLKGDASDNLPGVPGIGEKTAIDLLQKYQTLDGVYEHLDDLKPNLADKLRSGKDKAYMSKEVGRIWVDAPVELDWNVADINDIDLGKVAEILERFQFHSLVRRLPEHMKLGGRTVSTALPQQASLTTKPWPATLNLGSESIIHTDNETVWLSTDRKTFFSREISQVDESIWAALTMSKVVAYDVKQLYHVLAAHKIFVHFTEVHDIRQAEFLINPLGRDRSLATLTHDALTPETVLGELVDLYEHQAQALADDLAKNSTHGIGYIAKEFDFPLIYTLFNIEHHGMKLDSKQLEKMTTELTKQLGETEKQIFELVGHEFNIASPLQLSEVLFGQLKLPTAGIKKGRTGYSTGQKELDKLRGQSPIIELIEKSRELAKMKNTYAEALPKLAVDGYLHTTFNQDVASTGRLSSTNPNLQNIPIRSELGKKIREAFVPSEGNVFVSADYSQFELRLAAILSGDKNLISDFRSGVDIHTKTASEVYAVPLDEVTKNQRRDAKVINFGILYGMSPHGLTAATGMTFAEARKFIDQYFALRAPIKKFIDETLEKAKTEGYAETYFGRRRPTPDVKSSNFAVRAGAERAAINMPIQGTEADLMKRAMVRIEKDLAGVDGAFQVLQIHDSVLVECKKSDAERIGKLLQKTMEAVAPELDIPLDVDVSIGKNWGEL